LLKKSTILWTPSNFNTNIINNINLNDNFNQLGTFFIILFNNKNKLLELFITSEFVLLFSVNKFESV